MNSKLILALCSASIFAVSCAHKTVALKKTEVVQEKPVELKQEVAPVIAKKDNNLSYTCLVGQDKRTITLQKGDKRCEVHYSKSGAENQMAWAEKTPSICDNVFDNIRTNIEKGGFKCSADDGQKTAALAN